MSSGNIHVPPITVTNQDLIYPVSNVPVCSPPDIQLDHSIPVTENETEFVEQPAELIQPESKSEIKLEAKPEVQLEVKPGIQPETKPEVKVEVKVDATSSELPVEDVVPAMEPIE